jgi:hypothetical protein
MTIKVELKFTKADGSTPIDLFAWVDTLPAERQKEFHDAVERDTAMHTAVVGADLLHAEENLQKWSSDDAFQASLKNEAAHDPVWMSYWHEYLTVNEINFEHVVTPE